MVITLKDYKEIRQRYLSGESIRSISGHIHMSRQTVKRYFMRDFIPGQKKVSACQSAVMAQEVPAFIEACLETYLLGNLLQQKHAELFLSEYLFLKSFLRDNLHFQCLPFY